jgi:hypothetical protein
LINTDKSQIKTAFAVRSRQSIIFHETTVDNKKKSGLHTEGNNLFEKEEAEACQCAQDARRVILL